MKKISIEATLASLISLKKDKRDSVTLMGCKIPHNRLTANIWLDFDNTISPDMAIGIKYNDGTGTAYHATKKLPLSYYRPLTVRVDYSFYSRKNLGTKEFEYYDVVTNEAAGNEQ